jgi:hypothetical protein
MSSQALKQQDKDTGNRTLDVIHQFVSPVGIPRHFNLAMKSNRIDTLSSYAEAIQDREAIQRAANKINENRSTARAFLLRIGIITPSSRLKKAYL